MPETLSWKVDADQFGSRLQTPPALEIAPAANCPPDQRLGTGRRRHDSSARPDKRGQAVMGRYFKS